VSLVAEGRCLAKPFLKWAGGKTQLLDEIDKRLPPELRDGQIGTYVEPFIGGGAAFFHIAQKYETLEHFYLYDVNEDLVNCYNAIKSDVLSLIRKLRRIENEFLSLDDLKRKDFYYRIRERFNQNRNVAHLIFLNKTCYNGLYRVNRRNEFNAPFGYYKNPRICDRENLLAVSSVLEKAEVNVGDFSNCASSIGNTTFIYLDPPYRPISRTASFTSYSKESFSEQDQIRLAEFCKEIDRGGGKFLLSNSDPKNENPDDKFFETHYPRKLGFYTDIVKASRVINCKGSCRGEITELLITNYRPGGVKF